jgi:hypothetical protein
MSMFARVAIAAVAVLAVGLAWVNLGPGHSGIGAQPTPSPSPTSSPHPMSEDLVPLGPGTYVTSDPFLLRVSFTAPPGWEGKIGGPYYVQLTPTGRADGVALFIFDKVYADPCHYERGFINPAVGPSVDDLATALAAIPGLNASPATDISLGGYSGKQLIVSAPTSFTGCTPSPDGYAVWQLPLGANYSFTPGQVSRLWILDVDGQRLVIDVAQVRGQSQRDADAAQALLDSIQIAPTN